MTVKETADRLTEYAGQLCSGTDVEFCIDVWDGAEAPTWSESITLWQAATFGQTTRQRAWARFEEELEELIEADCEPREPNEKLAAEAADAVITLAGWLKAATGLDLAEAVERKMAINRARKWRLDGQGGGYHVKPTGGAE